MLTKRSNSIGCIATCQGSEILPRDSDVPIKHATTTETLPMKVAYGSILLPHFIIEVFSRFKTSFVSKNISINKILGVRIV